MRCVVDNCQSEGKKRKLFFWVQGDKKKYHLYDDGVSLCDGCRDTSATHTEKGLIIDFQWEYTNKLPPSTSDTYSSPVTLLKMAFRKPNQPKASFLTMLD